MTRTWANVAIVLEDVIGTGGAVVGKKATGCTSNDAAMTIGNELSYSRTEYDSAGRVSKSYSLNELRNEICGSQYQYDIAGRQMDVITLPGTDDETVTTTEYDGSRQKVTVNCTFGGWGRPTAEAIGAKGDFVADALNAAICGRAGLRVQRG